MQAIVGVALPMAATLKRGTRHTFIFVKAVRQNPMAYRTFRFLEYGMTNALNNYYKCGFACDIKIKRGNTIDIPWYKLAHILERGDRKT